MDTTSMLRQVILAAKPLVPNTLAAGERAVQHILHRRLGSGVAVACAAVAVEVVSSREVR